MSDVARADCNNNDEDFDKSLGALVNIIISYDMGRPVHEHDCRNNFTGSAKAMEADAGAELITNSSILKEANLKVKMVIGDKDSSLMAAVNKQNKESKLADTNHNKGRSKDLAKNVRCIPDHLYNKHDNCGTWCKNISDDKTGLYQPKFIIKSEELYCDLQNIFALYADNAFKYCISAYSQANEAFNHTVTSKFPKNESYNTSTSGDIRVASAVLTKNVGNAYLIEIKRDLGVPINNHLIDYCKKLDENSSKKSTKAQTKEQKRRRTQLVSEREKLRMTTERTEGVTYKSNIAFEIQHIYENSNSNELVNKTALQEENSIIVIFDLETSGRGRNADILQLAAVANDNVFSVYIEPTQAINKSASEINGLQNIDGELYLRNKKLTTVPIIDALLAFHAFLDKLI
ncbi:uncharacterized protein LOC112590497 [Harpegnathos saltator]|uniref:uncharacterized protein LOC112590497 n=1 Tax=Harpegnathos saltator TaxID=610380 RepID=UPI000DBED1DB|nr:uncharacterized protein LOC112590497 [Harpegnathos saltator]